MPDIDIRHLTGHRNQIVGHVGVGELTAFIILTFLEQRSTEALYHTTPDLLVDELRVDDGAAILDDPMLQQLDKAGVDIDLEPIVVAHTSVPSARGIMERPSPTAGHDIHPPAMGGGTILPGTPV